MKHLKKAALAVSYTHLDVYKRQLCDGLHGFGLKLGPVDDILASLPLAEYSMAWVSFFVAGLVIGCIWMSVTGEKKEAESV